MHPPPDQDSKDPPLPREWAFALILAAAKADELYTPEELAACAERLCPTEDPPQ